MVKIDSKTHRVDPGKEKDVNIKIFNKQIYFRNSYHLTSLINDIFIGLLYLAGSLANMLDFQPIVGQVLYLIGGFLLLMRPMINIKHNVFMYKRDDYDALEDMTGVNEEEEAFEYNTEDDEDVPEEKKKEKEAQKERKNESDAEEVEEEDDYEHY